VTPCAPAKKFPFIEQTSLSTSAEQRQQVVQPRTPRSSDATSCAAPEPRPELSESSRPVRFRPVWHQRHLAWCSREATDVLNCLHTKKRKRKKKAQSTSVAQRHPVFSNLSSPSTTLFPPWNRHVSDSPKPTHNGPPSCSSWRIGDLLHRPQGLNSRCIISIGIHQRMQRTPHQSTSPRPTAT
jgi:hypothetical protein